jgi:hypothetical protein
MLTADEINNAMRSARIGRQYMGAYAGPKLIKRQARMRVNDDSQDGIPAVRRKSVSLREDV